LTFGIRHLAFGIDSEAAYCDQLGYPLLPSRVICRRCVPSRSMMKTCALPLRVETNARWRPLGANAGLSFDPMPSVIVVILPDPTS
jgi:hypothetical protein